MAGYGEFAEVYSEGPYTQYSLLMAQRLPDLLKEWDIQPQVILDVACGEGTFAIEMAKLGHQVVGIDRSPHMIRIAERKAKEAEVKVDFRLRNMSNMIFDDSFDLVTCWFDSLNYLWSLSDIQRTFQRVHRALHPGGLFVFDINTIYGLSVPWAKDPSRVEWQTNDRFVVHKGSYNYDLNMSTIEITAFLREGELWRRIQESHVQKGYFLWEIRNALRDTDLRQLAALGDIATQAKLEPDSPRAWYVCQKRFEQPAQDESAPEQDESAPEQETA